MNITKRIATFGKDTVDVWKYQARYMKKHWPELVIISSVTIGIEVGAAIHQQKKWEKEMANERRRQEKEIQEMKDNSKNRQAK